MIFVQKADDEIEDHCLMLDLFKRYNIFVLGDKLQVVHLQIIITLFDEILIYIFIVNA